MTLLNKKRIKLVLGSIALVAICAVVFYFRAYPIKLNMVSLDKQPFHISIFLHKPQ